MRRGARLRDGRQSGHDARTRPADHPRRAAARRPAAARRRRRHLARRRPRHRPARCAAGRRRRGAGRRRPRRPAWPSSARRRRDQVHVVGHGAASRTRSSARALAAGAEDVAELPARGGLAGRAAHRRRRRRAGAPGATLGVVAGSGGAGATTFACALAQTAARAGPRRARRPRPARARASTGCSASTTGDGHPLGRAGHTAGPARRPAPARPRCPAADGLAVLTWGAGAARRARRRDGARGALGRAARPRPRACWTSRGRWTTWSPRRSPAASGCCSWWRPRWPGSPRPAGWPPWSGRSRTGSGLVVRGRGGAVPTGQVAAALGLPLVARGAAPPPAGRARRPRARSGARPARAARPGRPAPCSTSVRRRAVA